MQSPDEPDPIPLNDLTSFDCDDAEVAQSGKINAGARERISNLFGRKRQEAELLVDDPDDVAETLDSSKNWLQRFSSKLNPSAFENASTIFRMLKAYVSGQYVGFGRATILTVVAALLYCVSPVDVVPDFLPVVGLLDDVFVLAWTVGTIASEIRNFRAWERLVAAKSTLAAYLPYFNEIKRVVLCPGWMAPDAPDEELVAALEPIFPDAKFDYFRWDSNVPWETARDDADSDANAAFLDYLRDSSVELGNTAIFGHSLGARITARALAKLAHEPAKKSLWTRKTSTPKVAQAFLMGAAIDAEDPDLPLAAAAATAPLCNFFNRADRVLSYLYRAVELHTPLGLAGMESPCENYVDCVVSGHEEFFLDAAKNMSSVFTLLNPGSVFAKLSAFELAAKGLPGYLQHQFVYYANFFSESIDSKRAPER